MNVVSVGMDITCMTHLYFGNSSCSSHAGDYESVRMGMRNPCLWNGVKPHNLAWYYIACNILKTSDDWLIRWSK